MEYLSKVLGIKVKYETKKLEHIPNYLLSRYELKYVYLDYKEGVFVYLKSEMLNVNQLITHIEKIKDLTHCEVVLILESLTSRQREYLLRNKIPFIVVDKQIYLPFMAVYLQEKCDLEKKIVAKLDPASQLLFFYFIYNGAGSMETSQAVKDLSLSAMTISRASKQLEDLGLIQTKKKGVQKMMFTKKSPQMLFQEAKDVLINPVKRKIYVSKEYADLDVLSGEIALSKYSMLNEPSLKTYATNLISKWNSMSTPYLLDPKTQVEIELWRYDPKKLSSNGFVDILSLALSFKDEFDERVEEAVETMLDDFWRKLDDQRN